MGISRTCLIAAQALLFAAQAHAQAPANDEDPAIEKVAPGASGSAEERSATIRPEPLEITRPDVPESLHRANDVQIIVELIIDSEGNVSSATLVTGQEPYATATVAAAPDWKFVPARRDGVPVAAKIHFAVTFAETPDEPTGITPARGASPDPVAPPTPPEWQGAVLDEVVIMGEIAAPGATTMTREEVKNLAGAFGDPLRAIESMPGVTPIVSGLPLFFVRGAPPGNVGYFIDGIRVPLLYHAFFGPSVLHPAMIEEVSLSAGPMPAEFGRYAGATLEAKLTEINERKAEGSVRLIDAGAFAQSRFAKERGYVQLSGRYSYTALLLSLFSPGTRADYWDYQGRAGYALGNRDELSVMALGAYDYLGNNDEVLGGTEYHRIDLRWDHNFTPKDHLRTALTWGRDRTRSREGDIGDMLGGARINFEHTEERLMVRAGTDLWIDDYSLDLDPSISEPENYLTLFPPRTDVTGGAFVDVVIQATPDLRVIPGVRADHYTSLGETRVSVDPRLSAEYQVTDRLTATHSLGTAHQSPNFVPNVPGAQVGGLEGGLQRSLQADAKYEYAFPYQINASAAVFINGTQNLTDPVGLGQSFAIDETSAEARSLGRAYGFELYIKRPLTNRLGGFISYTYSASLRSFDRITTRPGYDRPHVLNAAITYEFGWDVRASFKFALASGIPGRRTNPEADGFVFDGSRSTPYVRLDAKVEKRFYPNQHIDWGIAIEVLNATYTGNVSTRIEEEGEYVNRGTAPITFPLLGADIAWR